MSVSGLLLILAAASTTPAPIVVKPFTNVLIEGKTREEGETRWSFALSREGTRECADPPVTLLANIGEPIRPITDVCVNSVLLVKNESSRPIQCRVWIDVDSAPDERRRRAEALHVVMPGKQSVGTYIVGRAEDVPNAFAATCRIVPAGVVYTPPPKECKVRIRAPNPKVWGSRDSARRGEQGDAVVEFAVDPESGRLVDLMLVSSSGYAALDNASLDVARSARGTSKCPGQRFHYQVQFRIKGKTDRRPTDAS